MGHEETYHQNEAYATFLDGWDVSFFAKYIDTCEDIGGSEFLWNQWCEGMAKRYPKNFSDANAVSFLHTDAILGIS